MGRIQLKPMRRDIPARCDRCGALVQLTAREAWQSRNDRLSHECSTADASGRLVQEAPLVGVRGRLVVLS